jgi:hypothetical protein
MFSDMEQRIRIEEIRNDEWFQKNYEPVKEIENEEVNLDDVNAAFDDPEVLHLDIVCSALKSSSLGSSKTLTKCSICEPYS